MGINKANIDKLINVLEACEEVEESLTNKLTRESPASFNMALWYNPCGTPSCIAGHASMLAGMKYEHLNNEVVAEIKNTASTWLGINSVMANALFVPEHIEDFYTISKDDAIITLKKLRDKGWVDWSHAEGYVEFEDDDYEE